MNKDVVITIRSSQNVGGGETEGVELITHGKYHYSKNGIRLSYDESELTGLDGTKTMFRVTPEEVVLSRSGTVCTQMVFHPGECSDFVYLTQFGTLQMGLDTRRMEFALDEHGGDMEIEYDIDFEKNFMSRNTFKINVRERGIKS